MKIKVINGYVDFVELVYLIQQNFKDVGVEVKSRGYSPSEGKVRLEFYKDGVYYDFIDIPDKITKEKLYHDIIPRLRKYKEKMLYTPIKDIEEIEIDF